MALFKCFQHRDTGAVYRSHNGKVDRLSWDHSSWLPSAYKQSDLQVWPFECLGNCPFEDKKQ